MGNQVTRTKHALGGHDRDSTLEKLWTDQVANGLFISQGAQEPPSPGS